MKTVQEPFVTSIQVADPLADNMPHRDEILSAFARVFDSGHYILGKEVAAFEAQFARHVGARHAIGLGSGTDALVIALLAAGVVAGDEVITVSHTAGATVAAIRMVGARPVLVDVLESSCCIDPDAAEAAVSTNTRAIVAVHL